MTRKKNFTSDRIILGESFVLTIILGVSFVHGLEKEKTHDFRINVLIVLSNVLVLIFFDTYLNCCVFFFYIILHTGIACAQQQKSEPNSARTLRI